MFFLQVARHKSMSIKVFMHYLFVRAQNLELGSAESGTGRRMGAECHSNPYGPDGPSQRRMTMRLTFTISFLVALVSTTLAQDYLRLHQASPHPYVWAGMELDTGGDVNSDGVADTIIGSAGENARAGRIDVVCGATGVTLYSRLGSQPEARFGDAVAFVGDTDGDGVDDFAASAPLHDTTGLQNCGLVRLYSGATGAVLRVEYGDKAGMEFGFALAGADLDASGRSDLVVATPYGRNSAGDSVGSVFIYDGPTLTSAPSRLNGTQVGARFGSALDVYGNWRASGRPVLVVGQSLYDTSSAQNAGRALIYGFQPQLGFYLNYASATGSRAFGFLGDDVKVLGDVDGDGFNDLALSSINWFSPGPMFSTIDGNCEIFTIPFVGNSLPSLRTHFGGTGDYLGISMQGIEDLDEDGCDEYVVASRQGISSGPGNGKIEVFSGATGALMQTLSSVSGGGMGHDMGAVPDQDGDGVDELLVSAPYAQELRVYASGTLFPGSQEDLELRVGKPGNISLKPDRRSLASESQLELELTSPMGTLAGTTPLIAAQFIELGANGPSSPGGFPEVHLEPSRLFIILNGSQPAQAPMLLPSSGLSLVLQLPAAVLISLDELMIQGFAVTSSAANGFFAASNGQRVAIL